MTLTCTLTVSPGLKAGCRRAATPDRRSPACSSVTLPCCWRLPGQAFAVLSVAEARCSAYLGVSREQAVPAVPHGQLLNCARWAAMQ